MNTDDDYGNDRRFASHTPSKSSTQPELKPFDTFRNTAAFESEKGILKLAKPDISFIPSDDAGTTARISTRVEDKHRELDLDWWPSSILENERARLWLVAEDIDENRVIEYSRFEGPGSELSKGFEVFERLEGDVKELDKEQDSVSDGNAQESGEANLDAKVSSLAKDISTKIYETTRSSGYEQTSMREMYGTNVPAIGSKHIPSEPCQIFESIRTQVTSQTCTFSELSRLVWKHVEESKIDPDSHVSCWSAFHTLAQTIRSTINFLSEEKEQSSLFDIVIALAQEARRLCTHTTAQMLPVSPDEHTRVLLDLAYWLRGRFHVALDAKDIEECCAVADLALCLQPSSKSMLRCEALRLMAKSMRTEFLVLMGIKKEEIDSGFPRLSKTVALDAEADEIDLLHSMTYILESLVDVEPELDPQDAGLKLEPCQDAQSLLSCIFNIEYDGLVHLLEAHSAAVKSAFSDHALCYSCFINAADKLLDKYEDDDYGIEFWSEKITNPRSIVLLANAAYSLAQNYRIGQGSAARFLAMVLYSRASSFYKESCDVDNALKAASVALKLQSAYHDRKMNLALLGNIFQLQFEHQGLDTDRDFSEYLRVKSAMLQSQPLLTSKQHSEFKHLRLLECPIMQSISAALSLDNLQIHVIDALVKEHAKTLDFSRNGKHHRCSITLADFSARLRDIWSEELAGLLLDMHKESLRCAPPGLKQGRQYSSFAHTLAWCFHNTHVDSDLNQAIDMQEAALSEFLSSGDILTYGFIHHQSCYSFLIELTFCRYRHHKDVQDLNRAINLGEEAIQLSARPVDDYTADCHFLLAKILYKRFQVLRQIKDLERSVELSREVFSLYRSSLDIQDYKRNEALLLFITSLYCRGICARQPRDIQEAISLCQESTNDNQESSPLRLEIQRKFILFRIGHASKERVLEILEEAIAIMKCSPAAFHDLLGSVLLLKYKHTGNISFLKECITLLQDSPDLHSNDPVVHASALNSLGEALLYQYIGCGLEKKDINYALQVYGDALALGESSESDSNIFFAHLGIASCLFTCFTQNKEPDTNDALNAALHLKQAIHCANFEFLHISQQLVLSERYAKYLAAAGSPLAPREYMNTILHLHDVLILGQNIQTRLQLLSDTSSSLIGDAASCAIGHGQLQLAIEALELGKGIFWQQASHLRPNIEELNIQAPDLLDEFIHIQSLLEESTMRDDLARPLMVTNDQFNADMEAKTRRQLAQQYEELIQKIQKQPGLSEFMKAPNIAELLANLPSGIVVVLNVGHSSGCCDALVLQSCQADVGHVQLSDINLERLTNLSKEIEESTQRCQQRKDESKTQQRLGIMEEEESQSSEELMADVLAMLWSKIVEPVFKHLNLQPTETPPHLWWIANDAFSVLPLHAAGIYLDGSTVCASDYVITSYAPTLQMLVNAEKKLRKASPITSLKILAVSQPATPGQSPLPCTRKEVKQIHLIAPGKVKALEHSNATVKAFIDELSSTHIVHLACHGKQNSSDPLKSAVFLYNGPVELSQFMQIHLQSPRLAFLSACETALGVQHLPNESVHLAASFVFVGFPSVIGTLWSIEDSDGPQITEYFYKSLVEDLDEASPGSFVWNSAKALHKAVQRLRESGVPLIRWMPFIHFGI